MPKTYTCEKCAKVFKQKSHYNEHQKKKIDCASQTNLERIIDEKVEQKVKEVVRAVVQPTVTTNVSDLQSFFEDLHNLLWNKVGLNPENALKHMTLFFAYRMMELQADALQLPNECRWSYISSLTSPEKMDQAIKKGINEFRKNPITKPFFPIHDIKKVDVIHDIVLLINRISTEDLQRADTLGEIFEYMLGRGMSTMADEGQYFTNRLICKLAFTLAFKIKGTVRRSNGTLCTFADWFCGTGGFTTEYIKGVKAHDSHVDWKDDKMAIYSQDQNESSVTTTLLNALITTGEPFLPRTIRMSNSFSDPIIRGSNAPFPELAIDYCFMNPPYGGDKSKGKAYKFAYAKGKGHDKRFLVNEDIQTIGIEDDDKVSAGVQLAMATLAECGVCCIVLPQGFFFGASNKCVELRKKLTEEYKIWYIVDIASGSFLNTGTKTSMMVFQKGVGATDTVSFIGLDEKVLVEANLDNLKEKNYTLNYKQYLPQSAADIDGFEMVKLGELIVADSGDLLSKESIVKGEFPIIGGGKIVGYHHKSNRDMDEIVISRVGNACLSFMNSKYYLTDNALAIVSKDKNKMLVKYLYYYLTQNNEILREQYSGTAQPVISKTRLYDIQIPLPSLAKQQEIVDSIDGFTQLAHAEEQSLKLLEKSVMLAVKWMGHGKQRVKLGEVCDIKYGDKNPSHQTTELYPGIGGGIAPSSNVPNWNIKEYTLIVSRSGSAGHISRYPTKASAGSFAFTCLPKDDKVMNDYLFFVVKNEEEYIKTLPEGTVQQNLNRDVLRGVEIPLPSLSEQQTLQSDFDEIRHKHSKIAEYKAKAHAAIQRLIPCANTEKTVLQEAHSSTCKFNPCGTGCTCRPSVPHVTEHESNSCFNSDSDSDTEYNPETWVPKEKAATASSQ